MGPPHVPTKKTSFGILLVFFQLEMSFSETLILLKYDMVFVIISILFFGTL